MRKTNSRRKTDALSKKPNGKFMRHLLQEPASSKKVVGNATTLKDFSVVEELREGEE